MRLMAASEGLDRGNKSMLCGLFSAKNVFPHLMFCSMSITTHRLPCFAVTISRPLSTLLRVARNASHAFMCPAAFVSRLGLVLPAHDVVSGPFFASYCFRTRSFLLFSLLTLDILSFPVPIRAPFGAFSTVGIPGGAGRRCAPGVAGEGTGGCRTTGELRATRIWSSSYLPALESLLCGFPCFVRVAVAVLSEVFCCLAWSSVLCWT